MTEPTGGPAAPARPTPVEPRSGEVPYLLGTAFYRMAYVEWGDPAAPPVVCVHGLTRNGRDFDPLAETLSDQFRLICPDLPGRGASEWLPDGSLYQPPTYVQALSHLLAAIGKPVAWIGTSLGGICGMAIAAAQGNPISRMVLNDIGPHIAVAALRRIRDYLPAPDQITRFRGIAELEAHLRRVHAPFGPMTDGQWTHLARISARPLPDGGVTLHYDPKLSAPVKATEPEDVQLWPLWTQIRVPVMAIRGETSDLLPEETFARMVQNGARPLVLKGVGHAPSLMDAPTIEAIRQFLSNVHGRAG